MGATESKPQQEPVIIYNPNVPLQFTPNLINSMEKKAEQLPARVESRQMEDIINKRVKEELEKIKKAEHSLQQKFYLELSEKNQSNEAGSKETLDDVETMIQRIMRSGTKELPPKVKECQEQVIQCYRNNQSRSLDCWKEVEQFKEAVSEEQKKFVATQQK